MLNNLQKSKKAKINEKFKGDYLDDFYLTFLGIPIADSIEKLNAMEWRQDFYDYLQNDPSSFLSDLSNEDFDVDGLTVDDLSFTVK